MVGVGGERTRKPMLLRIAIVSIVLLSGLLATAIAYRKSIAEALLMKQLRDVGLDRATFAVGRFDSRVLAIEDFSVGDGDGLDIAHVAAQFSAQGLFARRLDALQISGIRLRGTLDDAGLSFGSLDRLFEGDSQNADTGGPTALPAANIAVEDALVEIATAEGPLRARLELRVVETAPGQLDADAGLQVEHALVNFDARLHAAGSPRALAGSLELEARAAGVSEFDVSARSISLASKAAFSFDAGDIAIQPQGCAEIQIEHLAVKSILTVSKPLLLCLRSRSESGIRISKEGTIEVDLEMDSARFSGDLRIDGESQRVSGELPTVRMRASRRADGFEASFETAAGRLEFPRQAIEVRGIELEANATRDALVPSGRLRIEEIFDTQQPARFPKLTLNTRFESRNSSVEFTMEFANPHRDLVAEVDGTHDLSEAAGRADIHLHAIDFAPGKLQPATLFPALSNLLKEASGTIEMKGSAEWNADGMRGSVEVAARDVSATSGSATVEHLNAIVELNENGETLRDQTVSIGRLDFGLELTDGQIHYRLKPGGIVTIESTSWKFAGGKITTTGEFDPQSENRSASLVVKDVDLTRLFELVNLTGLSGSGTLDGELPIALVGDEIEIRNAVLRSSGEPGVIRYRPDPGMSNAAAADPQFATALTVLENFHYERLVVEVNGSATGTVVIAIHLAGVNPDYQNGHPIEFNLSVDARLSDLLRTGLRVYRMPEKIEKRLRAFAKKKL